MSETEKWEQLISQDVNYLKAQAEQTDVAFGCHFRMISKANDDYFKLKLLIDDQQRQIADLKQLIDNLIAREGFY